MIEVTFLAPILRDSADDTRQRPRHPVGTWASVELLLCEHFGGYSLSEGHSGGWVDADGDMCADVSRAYTVAVPGMLESALPLRLVVAELSEILDQRCIYVRYLGQSEILK